ncbi:MAG: HAD-IA family hydrolase [Stellaceae bacterium]
MPTSNRPFDLVIFDCDGVLVDSEPIIKGAHARVLTACGYPITEDELVERFCGMSDAEMLATIEHEWGRTLPPSYAERVGVMIQDGFGHSLVAIAGVAEALDSLRLPVCVASSSVPEQIRRKLALTGLLARFGEDLFSATMVARGKPAPDLFLYAAQQFAAAPDRCLVIEDSLLGIEAAIAAGMTAIGFCGGSHCGPEYGDRLLARGAALVITDMRELQTAMAKLVQEAFGSHRKYITVRRNEILTDPSGRPRTVDFGERMDAEIYLVRHGETEWNAQGRFQGCLDSPLTPNGREQARQFGMLLARVLNGYRGVTMHVSPLGRACETAEIVRKYVLVAAPIREPRIREVTIGSWDGLTHEDIDAGWPGMLHGSDRFNWYFRAPNGEAYDQAVHRVVTWLAEVQGTVIAVSHGLTGRLIRGAYLGLPRREALSLPVPQDIVWRLADGRIEALRAMTDD